MGIISTPICERGETEAQRNISDLPKVTMVGGGKKFGRRDSSLSDSLGFCGQGRACVH